PYLRVLGFNARGLEILRSAKQERLLPVVTRYAHIRRLGPQAQQVFSLECGAGDLYALCLPCPQRCGAEQRFIPAGIV
ncbi:MAG: nucleotidyltransferase family protein, partial [Clostridia bacterium]|nr:nucleotidyltransferase family protein [Clostridia bacterium]